MTSNDHHKLSKISSPQYFLLFLATTLLTLSSSQAKCSKGLQLKFLNPEIEVKAGQLVAFELVVENLNPPTCPKMEFSLSMAHPPAGLSVVNFSGNQYKKNPQSVSAGAQRLISLHVKSTKNASSGAYSLTFSTLAAKTVQKKLRYKSIKARYIVRN